MENIAELSEVIWVFWKECASINTFNLIRRAVKENTYFFRLLVVFIVTMAFLLALVWHLENTGG